MAPRRVRRSSPPPRHSGSSGRSLLRQRAQQQHCNGISVGLFSAGARPSCCERRCPAQPRPSPCPPPPLSVGLRCSGVAVAWQHVEATTRSRRSAAAPCAVRRAAWLVLEWTLRSQRPPVSAPVRRCRLARLTLGHAVRGGCSRLCSRLPDPEVTRRPLSPIRSAPLKVPGRRVAAPAGHSVRPSCSPAARGHFSARLLRS